MPNDQSSRHSKITILPGDGIGPEVTREAVRVLRTVGEIFGHEFEISERPIGGAALLSSKSPLPPETLQACLTSDAVLLGAVGGPSFDSFPPELRPEKGLLQLRQELGCFANLRPAFCFPSLVDASPLHRAAVQGTDIMIVRELLGGLYFGEPRSISGPPGFRAAVDTMRYREPDIERIARIAFDLARSRRRRLTSVDKANVLACSRLWRDVVTRVAQEYPDVILSHAYVDSCAMVLVARPSQFDVILTENMFGDILSDLAGGVVGSLGLLASASIGGRIGLYEPVHGSAPDIAGQGIANPLGAILSTALMLRHSFKLSREAECIEAAVSSVLERGQRTPDLAPSQRGGLSTSQMGEAVLAEVQVQSPNFLSATA
jgi:3-isopropylmalate dehydrogenase